MGYKIEFAAAVEDHLNALTSRQRNLILGGIEKHLAQQPTLATRNRKPMRPNPLATWELRIGDLRVYYRVLETPKKVVQVAAV